MTNSGYEKIQDIANDLAQRYLKGEKKVINALLQAAEKIIIGYLESRVFSSRKTATGVASDIDPQDLSQITLLRVTKALQKGSYTHSGRFHSYILTIANHVLLDCLDRGGKWVRLTEEGDEERGGDSESSEKPRQHKEQAPLEDDADALLMFKTILNLILDGLRGLENEDGRNVWVARVLLGKTEKEIELLFGHNHTMCATHFGRACQRILDQVKASPEGMELSFSGLKTICARKLVLEERDLDKVTDRLERKAIELAARTPLSPAKLGKALGKPPKEAMNILRAGIVKLSHVKITRKKVPAVSEAELGQWLWSVTDAAIKSYPESAPQTRAAAPSPEAAELAALCEVAVALGFIGADCESCKSLGELLGKSIKPEEVEKTAKTLGVDEETLMSLLANTLPPDKLDLGLLDKVAAHTGISQSRILAALRAGPGCGSPGQTRGPSQAQMDKFIDGMVRRVLRA